MLDAGIVAKPSGMDRKPALRPSRKGALLGPVPGLLFLVGGLLLLGCQNGGARAETKGQKEPGAERLPVDVTVLAPHSLDVPIRATGTLNPAESVQIVAELSRRLVRVVAEEGAQVKKGQVLFELDHSDLDAELGELTIQEKLAKITAERQAGLLAEYATSQAEYDAAVSQVEQLSAARRRLQVTLQKAVITAPFAGVLGLRLVSQGAWVDSATPLISIASTKSLKIDFKVPEKYAPYAQLGREFELQVEGHPEKLHAKISATEGSVDALTRALSVRAFIEDAKGVPPGSSAKIELPVRVDGALTVPAIAILPSAAGSSVFVEENGRVRSVPVELGLRGDDWVQVQSGLEPGARVVTSNLLRLKDGMDVEVRPAANRATEAPH